MSYTYNQSILMGRLTKAPAFHNFESGKEKLNFTLAVQRRYKNKSTQDYDTDFIPISLWGKNAENGRNILKKGSPVLIWGRLQVREYEKDDSSKAWITEVIADNFQVLESLRQYEERIENQKQS